MPERQHGNERGLRRGIVGRLGRGHAFHRTLAESLRGLGDLLLERVGREGAERRAAAGQHAERCAQQRAAQRGRPGAPYLLAGRPQRADLDRAAAARQMSFQVDDDLGDAEQAHGDGREVDAVRQLGDVEGEALGAGVDVGADQAEQQAEEHHGDRLDDRAAGQHDGGDEAERHQRAVVGRPELLGHARQRLGEQHDDQRADGAGEERADGRDRQCRAGAPIARHLVAVETGHHRRRFARQVDQDRGRRAAVGGAVVDAGQHDQRGGRRQVEGDRQQHGDGRHRPDAGQNADQRAEHAAQQRIGQVLEGDGDAQAEREIVQQFHVTRSRARCRCSCPIRP